MKLRWLVLGTVFLMVSCAWWEGMYKNLVVVRSISDVKRLFASSKNEIEERVAQGLVVARESIDEIIKIPAEERTFENTIVAYDCMDAFVSRAASSIITLQYAHKDEEMRAIARKALQKIQEFSIDEISQNKELYRAVKEYEALSIKQGYGLSVEESYYLQEILRDFRRAGLDLPQESRDRLKEIAKRIADLSNEFGKNINDDVRNIYVGREDLAGVDPLFVQSLSKEGDRIAVGVDYPTYTRVMETCSVESTRKALWYEYVHRGHPKNESILKELIALRDEKSHILGYDSYATYDIEDQMAKSPYRVREFLHDIIRRVEPKVDQEFAILKGDLPAGITLLDGKIKQWDLPYVVNEYKKKHFSLDEQEISWYFPQKHTIQALLSVYQKFFNLSFSIVENQTLWSDELSIVEVRSFDREEFIGFIVLDLFPRPGKYTHACHKTIVAAQRIPSKRIPGVSVVLANFARASDDRPALLLRSEATTFFHEFGHAMHALLGATQFAGVSGTQVKGDFVEMPSQMLEEWMSSPEILSYITAHAKTGKPLPSEVIERIVALRTFMAGSFVQRQAVLSLLSLDCYGPGAHKDPHALKEALQKQIVTHIAYSPDNYMETSFDHIAKGNYASKYYSYLWSKVFAIDLYLVILKHGLMNSQIGTRYAAKILEPGGGKDPHELLVDFLGREPNSDAFFSYLGL